MNEHVTKIQIDQLLNREELLDLQAHAKNCYGYDTSEQILANIDRMITITQGLLDDPNYFVRVWANNPEEVKREYEKGIQALRKLKSLIQ